jgi:hypothetical protein
MALPRYLLKHEKPVRKTVLLAESWQFSHTTPLNLNAKWSYEGKVLMIGRLPIYSVSEGFTKGFTEAVSKFETRCSSSAIYVVTFHRTLHATDLRFFDIVIFALKLLITYVQAVLVVGPCYNLLGADDKRQGYRPRSRQRSATPKLCICVSFRWHFGMNSLSGITNGIVRPGSLYESA